MLNVNVTEITIVDETRECLSRSLHVTLGSLKVANKELLRLLVMFSGRRPSVTLSTVSKALKARLLFNWPSQVRPRLSKVSL